MDAFEAAFRLPNILRRLFAEGAFSQAFVPIFAEYRRQRGDDETRALVGRVGTLLAVVLLGADGRRRAGRAVARLRCSRRGFAQTPGKVELTAEMIRIVFPYILFVSLVSLAGGVLNVYRQFAIPAFTPVLLNLSIIGAALFLAPYCDPPIMALAWGVFDRRRRAARAADPPAGEDRDARRGRASTGATKACAACCVAMGPAVLGVSAAQISALINTQLAAALGDGRISWITYADRLMEFPSALLGVALGTVLLPSLAKHHADANPDAILVAARLGPAARVPARAAGGGRAVGARDAARSRRSTSTAGSPSNDVLQTRAALLGYSVGPARAHPGQDPGAGLLRAPGDEDAGEDRVRRPCWSRRRSR